MSKVHSDQRYRDVWDGEDEADEYNLCDVYHPCGEDGPYPVFLYHHGGGLYEGDKTDHPTFCQALCDLGIIVVSYNYRLGTPTGKWENLYAAMADHREGILEAKRRGKRHSFDLDRIFIGGSSAGCCSPLFAYYGRPEMPGSCEAFEWQSAAGFVWMWGALFDFDGEPLVSDEGVDWIRAGDPPMLLIHGTLDANPQTPPEAAEECDRQCTAVGVDSYLKLITDMPHSAWQAVWQAIFIPYIAKFILYGDPDYVP